MLKPTGKPMTKDYETAPRKKGKATSLVVWALMAMLVLGLGGFGISNFGGGVTAIGKVGDREIETNDYARALQQEISALSAQFGTQLTIQQVQTFGLDQQVRQQLINTATLDNEASRIGLSAGDARIANEIIASANFSGPTGQFDRETYRFTLERNRMTEAKYETRMREDLARALLQGAISGGFTAPQALTDTLYAYISERRGLSLLRLTEADLASLPADPTEADLKAHYDANIAEFTRPEARRITYAALLPEAIADKMEVDENTLRKLYDERIAEFVQPERRLVERLVFPTEATATEAKAKLDAGTAFEQLVAERGVNLTDIDLGDMAEAELGTAGAAIFALQEPGVIGPFASDLGPALFRMNGILSAQNTTFDEARADLAAELATDAARRAIGDMIESVDDRLASGAMLEDLGKETDLTLGQLDFTAQSNEGMAAYPEFRKAAAEIEDGAFPEVIMLDDGGIFALRLDEIVPPTPIPLEEAREAVTTSWRTATITKALSDLAVDFKSKIEAGASLGGFGITEVIPDLTRSSTIDAAPASLLGTLFTMAEGQTRVIEDGGFVALARLDSITPGASEGPDADLLKNALAAQIEQALAQDVFTLYTNALTQAAGITLDTSAINAVHAQFQ
jgi:peptidyl-prolyl cis-trans isomerase D